MATRTFDAFLSYSHAADHELATALESSLQRFGKPMFGLRGMSVFRDQSNLSLAPHLWREIETALSNSTYFVLLASPESAVSKWVKKELEHWKATKSADTILIVQTGGELRWDEQPGDFDWSVTTCLSDALKGAFAGEPLYLDMRWATKTSGVPRDSERFTRAVAQIVAAISKTPLEDIYGEELLRQRRLVRLRNVAIGALILLAVAAGIGALVATQQTRVANGLNTELTRQIKVAEAERDRADETAKREITARQATEAQLQFISQVLADEYELRRPVVSDGLRRFATVFFSYDSAAVSTAARGELDRVGQFLRADPGIQVRIAGHFAEYDEAGQPPSPEYALGLSERRASTVRDYLTSVGVSPSRLELGAYGTTIPLIRATNAVESVNAQVRLLNSRAELYAVIR